MKAAYVKAPFQFEVREASLRLDVQTKSLEETSLLEEKIK